MSCEWLDRSAAEVCPHNECSGIRAMGGLWNGWMGVISGDSTRAVLYWYWFGVGCVERDAEARLVFRAACAAVFVCCDTAESAGGSGVVCK
jgi:hypothetical protein